jgi:hypothetical protein
VYESSNFAAMDPKKRLFNRVLLVSGGSAVLLFVGYLFFTHRPAQHFFLPKGYSGWVTVRFEKPEAAPLPEKDGHIEFHIPPSGILETSTKLKTGWSRDEFFWEDQGVITAIPKHVQVADSSCRWVHDLKEECMSYDKIILDLAPHSDTLLWDKARISKTENEAEVRSGRKTLLHFWVSERPRPYFYHHDSLPEARKVW